MKTTGWMGPTTKPVRPGVYQVSDSFEQPIGFAHWNGKEWGLMRETKTEARGFPAYNAAYQGKRWRGLTRGEYRKQASK